MHFFAKTLVACLSLTAILIGCSPVAESQTLRDRLLERRAPGGGGLARSSGTEAVPAGVQEARITVAGETRSFLYYVPPGRPARPAAVIALHGGRGSGAKLVGQIPSLMALADREGFVAVYPTAGGNWNDGRANFVNEPSDIPFMRAIADWLSENLSADRSRVFVLGVSNGGSMAFKIACDAPGLVAGIAPIISSMSSTLAANCHPAQSTPVVMVDGTDDPLSVYNGGKSTSRLAGRAPMDDTLIGVPATAEFWARVDGCGNRTTSKDLPDRFDDGTTVTLIRYNCPRDRVWLYRVNGGGHSVPGVQGNGPGAERLVGKTSQEIDAVARAVEFFKAYGL